MKNQMNKFEKRERRSRKAKKIIALSNRPRLVVFRSNVHIYAQIVVRELVGDRVLAAASTMDKELRSSIQGNKSEQAKLVGSLVAKRASEKGVIDVAFDRAGYRYHGRVKVLAEAAREAGLNF